VADAVARIGGEVLRPCELTMDELRALSQQEWDVAFNCRKSGVRRHRFAGPLLREVVALAEPVFVAGDRRDRVRFLISLRGGDGHRVVLSWAEIDPEFGNQPVLLGVSRDGAALDDEGPQLVVPGDVCGARNISRATELLVLSTPSP
jgi:hypothetical protein